MALLLTKLEQYSVPPARVLPIDVEMLVAHDAAAAAFKATVCNQGGLGEKAAVDSCVPYAAIHESQNPA